MKYDHAKIEKKWAKYWAEHPELFVADDKSTKPKQYILDMFPYPSGDGLHTGHVESYTATDIICRYLRMNDKNVLHPQGWDAFGLPAENYAIKTKIHPAQTTKKAIATFKSQMNMMGFSYDWSREVNSSSPEYYKWTQWFFLLLYKNGLAYKAKGKVNWCDSCQTVLANEQAEGGVCDRCGKPVRQKDLEQWYFSITKFIEPSEVLTKEGKTIKTSGLLDGLDKIDWPESTKAGQRNWIGRSEGAQFKMAIEGENCLTAKYDQVLLATNNLSKKARVEKLLKAIGVQIKIITPKDLGIEVVEPKEDGDLFENAKEKAELYRGKTELPILGIDTGFFMQGEEIDPVKVKRNALGERNEKELSQREIGKLIHEYYKGIVKKRGGKVNAYWQDVAALSLPAGLVHLADDKREVIITDQVKGEIDMYFPMRSLYISKATGKYIADQTEADELLEQGPFIQTLKKLLCEEELYMEVFTTRLDTVFGMTFALIAPEHGLVQKLKPTITNWSEVEKYIDQAKKKTDLQRQAEVKEKTGVELKGVKIINPFTKKAIPLFASDFVLAHYGTGAVMAVPAHDERDWDFARKFGLEVKDVIIPEKKEIIGVGAILETKKGKFLFQKRDGKPKLNPNKITLFAGSIENDENTAQALSRELEEELELKYDNSEAFSVGLFESNNFPGKFVQIFYIGNIDEKKLVLKEGEKILELNLEDILESDNSTDFTKGVIKYFKDRLNFSYTDDGVLMNSGDFNGLTSAEARKKLTQWLEKVPPQNGEDARNSNSAKGGENFGKKIGQGTINYKLRDWLVSRQRYWGAPIPIIYCDKCGEVPVPEKDLPVELPSDVDFMPTGESPLVKSKKFQNVRCPKCGGEARRESDTMDTFVCSSWYYLRYADNKNDKEFASKEMLKKWLPVDLYVGGAEHVVLHLLYARFFTKVLHKLGYIEFDEPFLKLRHQGIILAPDGRKMSKSWGNVINPNDVVAEYGADALRMFEMFMGPLEDMKPWNTKGIIGIKRFLDRVWNLYQKMELMDCGGDCQDAPEGLPQLLHKTIKKVTEDIENLRFNTAISQMMIFANFAAQANKMPRGAAEAFLILLAPFAPFMTEELWSDLGNKDSVFKSAWPKFNPAMVKDETIQMPVQVNGKVRTILTVSADISEEEAKNIVLSDSTILKWLEGKEPKKVIFVKGRLVNIVV